MAYDITDPAAVHRLQLEGREKLTVAGVEDVERFDDQCIVLRTGAGTLVVSGEGLHIGKLSLDGGDLKVEGDIDAVTYEEDRAGGREGFFARLLQNTDAATREAFFRTMEIIGKNLDEILLQFS